MHVLDPAMILGRDWHQDIIEPAVEVTENGTIIAPEKPGIGFEVKRDRVERVKVRVASVHA